MGFRINTNVSSLSAQRTLAVNNKSQSDSLYKLSSGSRINKAADDAAGLAISEKLKAQVRGVQQAERNANDGISMVQIAEGGLQETSNILTRLRELAMQSASDTITDEERAFTNVEYQNLKQEAERIAQVTEFNGQKLLDGSSDKYEFQIGINNDDFQDRIAMNTELTNATIENLGIADISVGDKAGAQESLKTIDNAIQQVSGQRSELGAIQNRLSSTIQNLQVTNENLSAANSRIRDTDYASETAKNTRASILMNANTSVLAQANQQGQAAMKLIG